MQLNVFYTLHEKMQSIDIGYFNLTLDIEEAFEAKRGDIREQVESLSMTKFKTTGGPRKPLKYGSSKLALENGSRPGGRLAIEDGSAESPARRFSSDANPPPAYSASSAYLTDNKDLGRANSTGSNWASAAKAKAAPPPPKPKPSRLSAAPVSESVTALYDYEAQAEGDLSFSAGETIEIVSRTDNVNEWWIGKIGVRQGQFPGMYIEACCSVVVGCFANFSCRKLCSARLIAWVAFAFTSGFEDDRAYALTGWGDAVLLLHSEPLIRSSYLLVDSNVHSHSEQTTSNRNIVNFG
jgi:amphiphysin